MITIIGGDGKSYGPVPVDQVRRWLNEGRATLETKAQRAGENDWRPLGEFEEFAPKATEPSAPAPASVTSPVFAAAGENAEEGPEIAARSVRLVAALIDTFLSFVFALPGLVMMAVHLLQSGGGLPDPENLDLMALGDGFYWMMAGLSVLTIFQMWMLTVRGQSVGKRVMGIKIVRVDDESNPGFVRVVILRSFIPGLIGGLPKVGIFFSLADVLLIFREDRRCIHDHLADTKVIVCEERRR